MMTRRAAGLTFGSLLLFVVLSSFGLGAQWRETGDRIDDAAFWRMFSEFSEPSGFFQSDNLVSNERTFPDVLPEVARRGSPKSAYVGVGPEQNFSYLAVLKPRIAFIVDIRRQNAILHLLYKALFELSANRADFLSRLLSRKRPGGVGPGSTVRDLFTAFSAAKPDASRFASNLKEVSRHLLKKHHFALTNEDLGALKYVYSAFFVAGPELQYSFGSGRRGRPFPSFDELMTAVDASGAPGSFLATEENYETLREMQRRNLIIPVVGNFAGPKALRSVADYLSGRGLNASVFYTSNVESYLFRSDDDWRGFYNNLTGFPVDRGSVLVRSVFGGFGGLGGFGSGYPGPSREGRLQLDPIQDLVAAFHQGEIANYADVVAR